MPSSSKKEKKKHEPCHSPPRFFTHPILVLSLALTAAFRYIVQQGMRVCRNSVFRYGFLPLVLMWCSVSFLMIPTRSMQLFSAMDTNGDGLISLQELGQFYSSYLRETPTPSHSGDLHPPPSTVGGASDHSSVAAHHAQKIAASMPTASVQHYHLNYSSFQAWWANAEDGSASAFYRRDVYMSHGMWREMEFVAMDAVFWLVLGILSSIGFGTGMHSGILFLFPHIYRTCAAADRCGEMSNFWTYPVNPVFGPHERTFQCISPYIGTQSGGKVAVQSLPSVWSRLLHVLFPCILWGAGTAIGEIPPYLLSYAAALKGKKQGELECTPTDSGWMGHMKRWTVVGIQRYGFWAVLLLSAWPNMAFDLCGMACGQFLLPFWSFFSAVLIGKAGIKVNLQALFFVALFSGDNVEQFVWRVGRVISQVVPPRIDVMKGAAFAVTALEKARHSISQPTAALPTGVKMNSNATLMQETSSSVEKVNQERGNLQYLATVFEGVVYLLMASFCISILEQLAGEELERRGQRGTKPAGVVKVPTAAKVGAAKGRMPTKKDSSRRKSQSHRKASMRKEQSKKRNTAK